MKLAVLLIYFGILTLIGYIASKRVKNESDYFVGGKKLGFWVVSFSARATGESGWLLLGLTGMGALIGVKAFWAVLGEVMGVALCWLFMAHPFKRLTDQFGSITIPDYLSSRFSGNPRLIRYISAIVISIFVTIYVSSQIDATGSAFESFFGWNYFTGAIVGFLIVLFYIFSGGFVAVAWSDLIQGIMMLLALVLLPIAGYFVFSHGSDISLAQSLSLQDPNLLSLWGAGGPTLINIASIIGFLMIGIGFLGSPQIFVRFMSIKDHDEIRKGTWVAILFTIITDCSAVLAGIFGRAILVGPGQNAESILGNAAQNVLPDLVASIFPSFIIAIYIAAVLSAIMSTIDSLLVLSSSAVTHDIYKTLHNPNISEEKILPLSRWVTFGMAFVALSISMAVAIISPTRTIFWFIMFGWAGISASFCPMMILSLFWKRYEYKGAIASMLTGFLGIPFFKFVAPHFGTYGPIFEELSPLPPAFILSLLIGILVTHIATSKRQEVSHV